MWIILPGVEEGEECHYTSGLWKSKILCMMVTISIITTIYTFTTFSKWDKSSKSSVGHHAKASFTANSAEPVLMIQTLETGADGLLWESFRSLSLHDVPLNTMTLKKCWLFNEAILGSEIWTSRNPFIPSHLLERKSQTWVFAECWVTIKGSALRAGRRAKGSMM